MLLIEAQKISCHSVIFEQLMSGSLNLSVFMELKLSLSKLISGFINTCQIIIMLLIAAQR